MKSGFLFATALVAEITARIFLLFKLTIFRSFANGRTGARVILTILCHLLLRLRSRFLRLHFRLLLLPTAVVWLVKTPRAPSSTSAENKEGIHE